MQCLSNVCVHDCSTATVLRSLCACVHSILRFVVSSLFLSGTTLHIDSVADDVQTVDWMHLHQVDSEVVLCILCSMREGAFISAHCSTMRFSELKGICIVCELSAACDMFDYQYFPGFHE